MSTKTVIKVNGNLKQLTERSLVFKNKTNSLNAIQCLYLQFQNRMMQIVKTNFFLRLLFLFKQKVLCGESNGEFKVFGFVLQLIFVQVFFSSKVLNDCLDKQCYYTFK